MFLCCGEALIDMVPVSAADGHAAYAPHTGGAVFNTAVGLGRLGVRTGFLGEKVVIDGGALPTLF